MAPAHGSDPPKCLDAPKSRDNHLGNTEPDDNAKGSEGIPETLQYRWELPDIEADKCVLRMRYNISVGDFPYELDASANGKNVVLS